MSSEAVHWLESQLQTMSVALPDDLEWKWDGRFGAALAEFSRDREDEMRALLEKGFTASWESANWKEAPVLTQAIIKKLGGLMPGQRLLVEAVAESVCVFCAWWPWGNGAKISIRIAPFGMDLSDKELASQASVLRGWFKI